MRESDLDNLTVNEVLQRIEDGGKESLSLLKAIEVNTSRMKTATAAMQRQTAVQHRTDKATQKQFAGQQRQLAVTERNNVRRAEKATRETKKNQQIQQATAKAVTAPRNHRGQFTSSPGKPPAEDQNEQVAKGTTLFDILKRGGRNAWQQHGDSMKDASGRAAFGAMYDFGKEGKEIIKGLREKSNQGTTAELKGWVKNKLGKKERQQALPQQRATQAQVIRTSVQSGDSGINEAVGSAVGTAVGKSKLLGKLGGLAKFAKIPVVGGLISAGATYLSGGSKSEAIGSGVGATAGAAVGSFAGPVGTIVGGIAGEWIGRKLGKLFNDQNKSQADILSRQASQQANFFNQLGQNFGTPKSTINPSPPTDMEKAGWKAGMYNDLIEKSAAQYGVDPNLIRGLIDQESQFNTKAISPKGAKGLMQLMPETAQQLRVTNPFDPRQSIPAGVKHLARLINLYNGDVSTALQAYNWGEGNVNSFRKGKKSMPKETREYAGLVYQKAANFRQGNAQPQKTAEQMRDEFIATEQANAAPPAPAAVVDAEGYTYKVPERRRIKTGAAVTEAKTVAPMVKAIPQYPKPAEPKRLEPPPSAEVTDLSKSVAALQKSVEALKETPKRRNEPEKVQQVAAIPHIPTEFSDLQLVLLAYDRV